MAGEKAAQRAFIYPSSITLSVKRNYKKRFTSRNNPQQDEPVGGNWLPITGPIVLPIWEYVDLYENMNTPIRSSS